MATFNSEGKMVAVRMLPELYHLLNMEISDINATGSEKFQDKNVNKEVMCNALLAMYLARPKDYRRKTLRPSLRVLENMLANREKPKETDPARLDTGIIVIPDDEDK